MTDTEFLTQAEQVLKHIEAACDRLNDVADADIDNQRAGAMVTIWLPNGSQIVVNLQKPLHEIWLAAKSGGYHFRFDGTHWMDTKGSGEFFTRLSTCVSDQAGMAVNF